MSVGLAPARSGYLVHYAEGPFSAYVRAQRLAGSMPIEMVEAAQPAGDFSDPAVDALVLIQCAGPSFMQSSNLGAGRFRSRTRCKDLFLVAPRVVTSVVVADPHIIRMWALPAAGLRETLSAMRASADPFDFGRLHAGPWRSDHVTQLASMIWCLGADPSPHDTMLADSLAISLAAALARAALRTERPSQSSREVLAPWQVRCVSDYVSAHLARAVSLAELAALVGFSSFHFLRAFKASTGVPPHRFLIQRRIAAAVELIRSSELPIIEVAARVVYSDPAHFAKLFRREVGTSPSAYRREQRA